MRFDVLARRRALALAVHELRDRLRLRVVDPQRVHRRLEPVVQLGRPDEPLLLVRRPAPPPPWPWPPTPTAPSRASRRRARGRSGCRGRGRGRRRAAPRPAPPSPASNQAADHSEWASAALSPPGSGAAGHAGAGASAPAERGGGVVAEGRRQHARQLANAASRRGEIACAPPSPPEGLGEARRLRARRRPSSRAAASRRRRRAARAAAGRLAREPPRDLGAHVAALGARGVVHELVQDVPRDGPRASSQCPRAAALHRQPREAAGHALAELLRLAGKRRAAPVVLLLRTSRPLLGHGVDCGTEGRKGNRRGEIAEYARWTQVMRCSCVPADRRAGGGARFPAELLDLPKFP